MDEGNASIKNRGDKACEITGHSAAESDDEGRTVVPRLNQFAAQAFDLSHRFRGFACREDVGGKVVSYLEERGLDAFQEMRGDIVVGDDGSHAGESGALNARTGFGEEAWSDEDFVRAGA